MHAADLESFDVVVVGGGPGGAVAAIELSRRGRRVLVLEREGFPRFHIGESLTGTAGDFIRQYGLEDDIARHGFPEKTGVKVIGRGARSEFFVPVLRPTWQVRRAEFDALLLERAEAEGATVRRGTVQKVLQDDAGVQGVGYRPAGDDGDGLQFVKSHFVVDASGASAFLCRQGIAGPRQVDAFGRQIALFTHVRGAVRDPGEMGDNTFIFYGDAHHWAWFIPLGEDLVSVGVVMPVETYKGTPGGVDDVFAWGCEHINVDLARRVRNAKQAAEPVRAIRDYSYRVAPFAGPGWLCVGDAHRFTDPIFSFGVSFAMTEADRAAETIDDILDGAHPGDALESYTRFCERGQRTASDLIRYFWKFPSFFAFQTRGALRRDFIRLLAGDCFDDSELEATRMMRESLATTPGVPAGRAAAIAARVQQQGADVDSLLAAHLSIDDEDGVCLSLVVDDERPRENDALHDFEEALYIEFGRDALAVLRFDPSVAPPPRTRRGEHPIYSRPSR